MSISVSVHIRLAWRIAPVHSSRTSAYIKIQDVRQIHARQSTHRGMFIEPFL
jgi:hypothetical protein